jgi:hypothetical protein
VILGTARVTLGLVAWLCHVIYSYDRFACGCGEARVSCPSFSRWSWPASMLLVLGLYRYIVTKRGCRAKYGVISNLLINNLSGGSRVNWRISLVSQSGNNADDRSALFFYLRHSRYCPVWARFVCTVHTLYAYRTYDTSYRVFFTEYVSINFTGISDVCILIL